MDPVTLLGGALLGTAGGYGGALFLNKVIDYMVPIKYNPQYKIQTDRDNRLKEFQRQQQRENQIFQQHRDEQQRAFQLELEADRMAFQERMEMRRLQLQKNMEEQRERLTLALNSMNIKSSQEIAQFNAIAMRQTQILVARENAQNLLQDRMVQDSLKTFPLNISPLVLLKNRPHALSSLLRFTVDKAKDKEAVQCNMLDLVTDVMGYIQNPEALNIFVAPVYVDTKIRNREVLSRQIWDSTYQRLESFFTKYYNRRGRRPVVFYPTAWNDKYSPGMHASETLHFFLRDMPCLVIEPRFDGNNFRVMVSSWGLGYASTEHNRTELDFQLNIDAILAYSVYLRSWKALEALDDLLKADIEETEKTPFRMQQRILERNIKLFESLHIEERIQGNRMDEIDALGIYNIFKIEPVQDLELLSESLSSQIGMTLAALADIHHLHSTDTEPVFPSLMKTEFPELYAREDLRKMLFQCYEQSLRYQGGAALSSDQLKEWGVIHNIQKIKIGRELGLECPEYSAQSWEEQVRKYCKEKLGKTNPDFSCLWQDFLDGAGENDVRFIKELLSLITEEEKKRELRNRLSYINNKNRRR